MPPVKPQKPLAAETVPTVGSTVRSLMVESIFTNLKPTFLPQGKVDDLVTRRLIIWAFYKCEDRSSLTVTKSVEKVIGFILTKAKKIFSILVYISLKGASLYGLLRYLIEWELHDIHLPFRREQIDALFPYITDQDVEDIKGMRLDREAWNDDHVNHFAENQWKFCAPVFSTCIDNHDIVEKSILPFIYKNSDSVAAGAFGEVMKYKIHDSHLDTSGLVSDIALKKYLEK